MLLNFLVSSPYRLALLQICLHTLSKIGTAIDACQYIVERNSILRRIQAPVCLLGCPDRKRGKSADLLCNTEYMPEDAIFVDDGSKKSTLQGISCREQLPGEQHLFGSYGTK